MDRMKVEIERVGDIPLLLEQLLRMNVQEIFDQEFPCHGNWQGLSPGYTLVVWLAHILSQADHRLNRVEIWAGNRLKTISGCINQQVRALDFSDDRLADILELLSDDVKWVNFEQGLNGHTIRIYNLSGEPIRVDSTTANGYWRITEDGLFQLGHSKNHRPDLPQVKVNLSTLDPLGMPLVTQVLPGNSADDPLYVPAIKEIKESFADKGLLYIGDCKMGALAIRAFISKEEDFYLCPLSALQVSSEQLDAYLESVFAGEQTLSEVYRPNISDGRDEMIADGFEKSEIVTALVDEQEYQWEERQMIIRSLKLAEAEGQSLDRRLAKAHTALQALNERKRGKKRPTSVGEMQSKVEAIIKKYRVVELFDCHIEEITRQRVKRRHSNRPEQVIEEKEFKVTATLNEIAVEKARRRLGWRVYATNHCAQELPLEKAVLAYRNQYIIERDFGRLKGKQLSLSPSYLQREDHVIGLVRLLSIALRILTLLEFVVRRSLANARQELAGLYPGNPKRSTARPTSELILEAFHNVDLATVHLPDQVVTHTTELSILQQRILELLEFPPDIYRRLSSPNKF